MKATEPAGRLLLLVPALSEAKGWHWQWGQGAQTYPSRKASWKRTRCARMSLNFSQILKGSYTASLKSEAAAMNITVNSSRTVRTVKCFLASRCMALGPEIQDPSCYL